MNKGNSMKSIIYKITGFIIWLIYSNILIYASFYYNWKLYLNDYDVMILTLIILIMIVSIIYLLLLKKNLAISTSILMKFKPLNYFIILLASIFICFFYFGKSFLYEHTGYWITFEKIHFFLLLCFPTFIFIFLSFEILDIFIESVYMENFSLNTRYHFIILFLIQSIILGVYFYGLNPGNMSYDTYNQVCQLKGIIKFNTWHPIGHTLFIGLLLKIWDNYAIITIFQILIFTLVTTSFYITLLKNNIKWQVIYLAAIVISGIPSTGVNVVTQWKDIPFTVGLLWGTLIIFKMCLNKDYFRSLTHIFEFVFCLFTISLFRFNGILAFILMLIYALIYSFKSNNKIQLRNYSISTLIILVTVILVNILIPNKLDANPNPPGMKLRPIYQGLAAIYVNGVEEDLSKESRKLIEAVSTKEQMKDYYNPYFADTISSNTPEFLNKLSKISTGDALKMYIEAAIVHPEVVIGDKLNLATTMWSVTKDPLSYNNAYTTVIQKEMIEEFKVERKSNKVTIFIEELAKDTFHANYLLNALVWRPGFYLSMELILLIYLISIKDKRISIFIPLLCNALIVFLTMPAQDYRYLWFISLLFPFIVLACSVKLGDKGKGGYKS